jgi:hypothetical protein
MMAVLLLISLHIAASSGSKDNFRLFLTLFQDTVPTQKLISPGTDTIKKTLNAKLVSTKDTLSFSKDSIEAPIEYTAEDSGVLIISTKEFILYGKAKTTYQDVELEAAKIAYQQDKQQVKASGSADTSANSLNKTKFKQGEMTTLSDSITYNLKSQKGITHNTYYQEGELFVNAQKLKKADSNVVFAYRGTFTTCNLDTPHFVFRTKKMKIINNKIGVSGPTHPEFEGVPVPVYIPFGIYPLNRGRHSGILVPTFTSSEDFGLGLEGLGYYKVINDYLDITTRMNIYSYGGWNLNFNPKYLVRYRYSGAINIAIQNNKTLNRSGFKAAEEFSQTSSYMINWSHSRDSKARPGTNLSANVNFGSTKFNRNILNNPFQNFNNQLQSSIAYSKTWDGKYNLSLNLNHDQNNNTKLVNLSLPTGSFNVVTLYPFQKKEAVGSAKWYEKLGVGYSTNFQNRISFYDSTFNVAKLLDTMQWGMDHNIPITLSLPSLGPITIAPSVSFQNRWFGQRIIRQWSNTDSLVKTRVERGFYTQSNMSFGVSANTRIFGTYQFKKGNIKAIRHEIRPNFGLNYKPDLVAKDFYNLKVDTSGRTIRVSKYDGGLYGSFSEGNFGGISFGVDNLLEMKVRDKKDTSENAVKKVKLIDGFGFNSSYNLMADSFALGDFTFYFRSTLFEKINITANANMTPYDVDKYGNRKNSLLFSQGKFGRFTNGSIAMSTNFQSKPKDEKKDKQRLPNDPTMTPDEQQRQLDYARQNPAEFTDFNIPWRIDLSYSFSFNRTLLPDYSGFTTSTFSSINFNGDFSLSPKWKAGGAGFYDLSNMNLQQFSMFVTREMHCWQLAINITPVGLFKSFSIAISPKSGILRDLRINRNRTFSNQ